MKRTFFEIHEEEISSDDEQQIDEDEEGVDLIESNIPPSNNQVSQSNQKMKPGRKAYSLSSYTRPNIIRELQECDYNNPVHIVSSINNYLYKNLPEGETKVAKWPEETDRLFRLHLNQWLKDNKDDFYIKCWGIFSLGIPGKTGQSCSEHYRTVLKRKAYFLTSQESQRGKRLSKQECQKVLTTFNFKGPADIYFVNIPQQPTMITQKQSTSEASLAPIYPTGQASPNNSGAEHSVTVLPKPKISENTISVDKPGKSSSSEAKDSKHSPSTHSENTDYIDIMISDVLKLPTQQESEKTASRILPNQNEKNGAENSIPRDLNQRERSQVDMQKTNSTPPSILQHNTATSQATGIESQEHIDKSRKKTRSEDYALHREQQIAITNVPTVPVTARFVPSTASSAHHNEHIATISTSRESPPAQRHPFHSSNSVFKQSLPPSSHDTSFHPYPSSQLATQAVRNIQKQEATTSTVSYPTQIEDWTVDKVVEYLKSQCNVSDKVAKYARAIELNGRKVINLCEGGVLFKILENSPLSLEILLRLYGFITQGNQQ